MPSVIRAMALSALVLAVVPRLPAADWESGAIAYTARKNGARVLILRGVTDIVGPGGDETYGDVGLFQRRTETVMKRLFAELPSWLARIR